MGYRPAGIAGKGHPRRKALKLPVLIIAGDSDVMTLEHSVAFAHLLGGGAMGDMGQPLQGLIEPFLKGETPKGMFDQ